jgi:hypothetical protein
MKKMIRSIATIVLFFVHFSYCNVTELDDSQINVIRKAISEGENVMLYFYSTDCKACNDFNEVFDFISQGRISRDPTMRYYKIDTDPNPEFSMRFFITKIPNLFHIVNGKVFDLYDQRSELIEYFKEKRWRNLRSKNFITSPFGVIGTYLGIWAIVIRKGMSLQAKYELTDRQMTLGICTAIIGIITLIIFIAYSLRSRQAPELQSHHSSPQIVPSIEINQDEGEEEEEAENSKSESESEQE